MLGATDLFAKAKALVEKPIARIYTPELVEYIGADIDTPIGIGRIWSIAYSHTRRIQGKAYKLYTLTIDIGNTTYTITTYEHTQWDIR